MSRLAAQFIDDLLVIGQACRDAFWEVADLAQDVRSRVKRRRTLIRLADREQILHQQLGRAGHALLSDGVTISRTPDFDAMLEELDRLGARHGPDAARTLHPELAVRSSMSARRLMRTFESGDWRVHTVSIENSSPWIGRSLSGERPDGLCVAVQRNHVVYPFNPEWSFRQGDVVVVVAPASHAALWEQWMARGSTDVVDGL
jgi:hypothetical protein